MESLQKIEMIFNKIQTKKNQSDKILLLENLKFKIEFILKKVQTKKYNKEHDVKDTKKFIIGLVKVMKNINKNVKDLKNDMDSSDLKMFECLKTPEKPNKSRPNRRALDCKGLVLKGADGRNWVSVKNKSGWSWRLVKDDVKPLVQATAKPIRKEDDFDVVCEGDRCRRVRKSQVKKSRAPKAAPAALPSDDGIDYITEECRESAKVLHKKAPSRKAKFCKDLVIKGLDGNNWRSKQDVNGRWFWSHVKEDKTVKSAKKIVKKTSNISKEDLEFVQNVSLTAKSLISVLFEKDTSLWRKLEGKLLGDKMDLFAYLTHQDVEDIYANRNDGFFVLLPQEYDEVELLNRDHELMQSIDDYRIGLFEKDLQNGLAVLGSGSDPVIKITKKFIDYCKKIEPKIIELLQKFGDSSESEGMGEGMGEGMEEETDASYLLDVENRIRFEEELKQKFRDAPKKSCLEADQLLKYVEIVEVLGSGSFGEVVRGCLPSRKKCDFNFAIKQAKSSSQTQYELELLKLLRNNLLDSVNPNVIFMLNNFQCENCYTEKFGSVKCDIMFFELGNGDLEDFFYENFSRRLQVSGDKNILNSCFFQLMAGVESYQTRYQISNADIKGANILYYKITPGGYFKYNIDGVEYNVPNYGYLFAISDFGIGRSYHPDYAPLTYNLIPESRYVGTRIARLSKSGTHELRPLYNLERNRDTFNLNDIRYLDSDEIESFDPYENYKPRKKQTQRKCKGLRKTVSPKCEQQPGCKWVVGSGCRDDESFVESDENTFNTHIPLLSENRKTMYNNKYAVSNTRDKTPLEITMSVKDLKDTYKYPPIDLGADVQNLVKTFTGGSHATFSDPRGLDSTDLVMSIMKDDLSKYLINNRFIPTSLGYVTRFLKEEVIGEIALDKHPYKYLARYLIKDYFGDRYSEVPEDLQKMGPDFTSN